MIDWQALVNEYRSRELTWGKDRIVAFAGIARAFRNLGALTYLAGAWLEFLPLSLLWYVGRKSEAAVRHLGPGVIRGGIVRYPVAVHEEVVHEAPSWSQFSVPIYTHHQTLFVFNKDEVFIRCKSFRAAPRDIWDDIYWATTSHTFRFDNHAPDHFPDPTGFVDFAKLELTLDMPIRPVRVSWPAELSTHFDRIRTSNALDVNLDWIPDFTYYSDSPDTSASPPRRAVLALIAEFQICRVAGECNIQRRFAGLALVRGEREGTWIRVGAWKLKVRICGVDVNEGNVADVAKRWSEYNMWEIGETWKIEKVTLI
jgi:hypothetical protein